MIDALVHTKWLVAIGAEAAAAEAAGHGAVWVSETGNDPFLHSYAAATSTNSAEIGTAIAVAFARSPMTVAQTAWQLADVSGGRFRLGLGSQVKAHIERRFSMPWGRPVEQMRDFLDALSAIWESWRTGERLQHEGPYYRHTLMAPFWVPEPHDHPIPVWLAGVGPAMLALAGERCAGVLLHPFATRAYDEAVVLPALQKGLAASGRTLDDFGVSRPVFMVMGDTEAELIERRRDACRQIAFYASTRAYQPVLDAIGYGALQPELAGLAARGEWDAMADLVDGEVLDHFAVVGRPEDMPDLARRHLAPFVTRTASYFGWPVSDPDRLREIVGRFAMTQPQGFGDVIADVARRWPQRRAIEVLGGPAVTYRTFDDRTTRLANALLSVAAPGDRVAAWLPTGVEYLEVYGAVAKAGLVLVPVHERFTADEAAYLLDDSQARVLIHGAPMEERVAQLDTTALGRVVSPAAYEEFLSAGAATRPAGPAADDLFLVAYTSGTTGFPKGAMVTHRAVLRGVRVTAMASRLVAYGTQAYASSMSFVPTVTAQILPHLALAGRVLLCDGWEPGRVVDAIDRQRATYVYVPTPGLADFAAAVIASGPQRCPSLATVLHAGSKARPAALAAAAHALGSRFVEGWGMTENSGFLLTATTAEDMAPPGPSVEVLASVGRPVPGAEIDVVADDGTSLPRDGTTVGGLRARSATLMRGYWRNDRATAAAPAADWYATGDVGTIDPDGYVTVLDRRDDLILSGGANIYPSELERVIAAMAGVRDVAVVGVDDPRWGQTPVAFVVADGGVALDEAAVVAHCRRHLASYKKPSRVLFVGSLPRNAAQKVLRAALRTAAQIEVRAGS